MDGSGHGQTQDAPPAAPPQAVSTAASSITPQTTTTATKRTVKQKTPAQKEALEAAFLVNSFPDDATKRALSATTGLTESQISTWFSHRRKKERDALTAAGLDPSIVMGISGGGAVGKTNSIPSSLPYPPPAAAAAGSDGGGGVRPSGGAHVAFPLQNLPPPPPSFASGGGTLSDESDDEESEGEGTDEVDYACLDAEDRARLQEYDEILFVARSTMEEPYREDGPPLGFEFDEIPVEKKNTGGGKSEKQKQKRKMNEQEGQDGNGGGGGGGKRAKSTTAAAAPPRSRPLAISADEMSRMLRDDEARTAAITQNARQQVQQLEAAIKVEQQRLVLLHDGDGPASKAIEREIVRLETERRRHLERVLREQRKDEERRAKEEARQHLLQQREEKRLAAARERELKAEEKRREKEERQREREAQRMLFQKERQGARTTAATAASKDDLDIEWEVLMAEYRTRTGLPADVPTPQEGSQPPVGYPPLPQRPDFPAHHQISLSPALIISGSAGGEEELPLPLPPHTAGALLSSWAALSQFAPLLGLLHCPSVDDLLAAVVHGSGSQIVSQIHIALLRFLQADAEESYAVGDGASVELKTPAAVAAAAAAAEKNKHHVVHVIAPGARLLEEAWAWGFDVDAWRAHLNPLTWPEIAREIAISAGLGRRRPQTYRRGELARMGKEGEDVVVSGGGKHDTLELQLPVRLAAGTVKGASWLILKDIGPEGLHVEEIARRIQREGLRDLRTSKSPETSISGALARDVLFYRVMPNTFALQSVWAYHRRMAGSAVAMKGEEHTDGGGGSGGGGTTTIKQEETTTLKKITPASSAERDARDEQPPPRNDSSSHHHHHHHHHHDGEEEEADDDDDDEDDEEESEAADAEAEEQRRKDEAHEGEPWVAALRDGDYASLNLEERLSMLSTLCHLVLESPTVRDVLDRRLDERIRIKKVMQEETKHDASLQRQRKQVETAARLKLQAAEEEALKVQQQQQQNGEGASGGAVPMEIEGSTAAVVKEDESGKAAAAAEVAALEAANEKERLAALKRSQTRNEAALRELEVYAVRAEPLGMDRRYNRYWRFVNNKSTSAQDGRVFVERQEDGMLRVLCSAESLDALMTVLDRKGPREKELYAALARHKSTLIAAMPTHPLTTAAAAAEASVQHQPSLQEVQAWCPLAAVAAAEHHAGGEEFVQKLKSFTPNEPLEMTVLKGDLLAVEFSLSEDLLDDAFDPDEWRSSVKTAVDAATLRRCLGQLENAVVAAALHSEFNREPLLVKGAWIPIGEEVATAAPGASAADILLPTTPEAIVGGGGGGGEEEAEKGRNDGPEHLSWLPPTCSAVFLRLAALDAALKYDSGGCSLGGSASKPTTIVTSNTTCARDSLEGYHWILRPSALPQAAEAGLVRGHALEKHGKIRPMLLPSFPHRYLFRPRVDFSFDVKKFKADVAVGSDDLVVATAAATRGFGRGGKGGRGRPRGRKLNLHHAGGGGGGGEGGANAITYTIVPTSASGGGRGKSIGGGGGGRGRGGLGAGAGGAAAASVGGGGAGAKQNQAGSDSDRHYGSDYDDGEDNFEISDGGGDADSEGVE